MSGLAAKQIEPIFISVAETAEMLGVKRWAVYDLIKDDGCALDVRYMGRRCLISLESVREYAKTLPTQRPQVTA